MPTSRCNGNGARAADVRVTDDELSVDLVDGRTLAVPLAWYPRLLQGRSRERTHWRLIGGGIGIHWPDLDEDISVEGLLAGKRSGETQESLRRWMDKRGTSRSNKRMPPTARKVRRD